MKFLKTKILIIFLVVVIFPCIAFGYFAVPDQYTHSMSFGVENKNLPDQDSIAMPVSITQPGFQPDIQPLDGQLPLSHNKLGNGAENSIFFAFLLKNITWIIFICAVFIIVAIFLLLKMKKVL